MILGSHPLSVQIPHDLQLPVSIDGKPASALDATRLEAIKPDYTDAERSAWRLDGLFRAEIPSGRARIAAFQKDGVSVVLEVPAKDAVPVLLLNRRGQIRIMLVDPASPFPGYRLRRATRTPGYLLPHVIVQRIEITNQP